MSIAGKFNFMISLIGFLLIFVFLFHIFSLLSCIFKLKNGISLINYFILFIIFYKKIYKNIFNIKLDLKNSIQE